MFFSFALLRMRMKTEPVKARKQNWKKKLPQDTRIPAAGSEYLLFPALRVRVAMERVVLIFPSSPLPHPKFSSNNW